MIHREPDFELGTIGEKFTIQEAARNPVAPGDRFDLGLVQAPILVGLDNRHQPPSTQQPVQPPVETQIQPAEPAKPAGTDREDVDWMWPVKGKVLSPFTEGSKGVDLAGRKGSPVVAAASGRVVYAGAGLRGYGKLVIIKHNNTWLSAYAHNDNVVVKEQQDVRKGQRIAEMGSTDADQVKLHFEVRRVGKPVDPAKILPAM